MGGLADWFAVTALFRHPLGLPIPHTAIIPARRTKLIESITSIIQEEWLSPAVIHARLARLSPSTFVTDWLRDRAHMPRLARPVRHVVSRLVHLLAEEEVALFLDRTLRELLWERGTSASLGPWLYRIASSESADGVFATVAKWLAGLTASPEVTAGLYWSLERLSHTLHADGQRLLAFFLRRPKVQQKIVEALSQYATVRTLPRESRSAPSLAHSRTPQSTGVCRAAGGRRSPGRCAGGADTRSAGDERGRYPPCPSVAYRCGQPPRKRARRVNECIVDAAGTYATDESPGVVCLS